MINLSPEQRAQTLDVELGGIYEIGGHIAFDVSTNKYKDGTSRKYTYPKIGLGDNNLEKMDLLKNWFGGSVSVRHNTAYQWNKKGNVVPDIVSPIAPYAPSREVHLLAYELWRLEDDPEEKIKLAYELQASQQAQPSLPSSSVYKELVANPRFLAGVFFARGNLHRPGRSSSSDRPRVMFNSLNRGLLEAVQNEFGGHISNNQEGGHSLDIEKNYAQKLLEFIYPHLLYKPKPIESFIQ